MDQFENIFLNSSGAESGVNIGRERTFGVEAAFTKGSFARDGFAAQLSFTYDYSRFRYSDFASGNNVIDIINQSVQNYNSYTSACAKGNAALCGASGSANALPSFTYTDTVTGLPVTVANPYYNAKPQPLFDRNAEYMPYDAIPDQPYLGGNGFGAPEVATLLLNYKNKKYNISPSLTFTSGSDYGAPLSTPGINPAACSVTSGVSSCGTIIVPDQYTGKFDNMGAFSQPWRYTLSTQIGYQMTPRMRATLTLTGLIDNCIQRGYAWDRAGFCAYSTLPYGDAPSSPTEPSSDPNLKYPYTAQQGNNNTTFVGVKIPFQMYLNLQYRI
jgi:hypothetical protein